MQLPILSVIVCTYNREKYIGKCLEHLANQSIDNEKFEIVLVNNVSTDNTEKIVLNIIEKYPEVSIQYFVENNQGHTFARNRGILESTGTLLSFIDDDAFVKPDFCHSIINFFNRRSDVVALGGRIIPSYEKSEPPWMSQYLLPLVAALDKGDKEKMFKGWSFPIGANMAFRKTVFDKYGNFDVNLGRRGEGLEGGDEKEVFLRLKKKDEKIYYVPSVVVDHIIPPHRVEKPYIKGLAIGVGSSERKRIGKYEPREVIIKLVSEKIKIAATLLLAIGYLLKGQTAKAAMLIRFRYWIIRSLISPKI